MKKSSSIIEIDSFIRPCMISAGFFYSFQNILECTTLFKIRIVLRKFGF